MNIILVDDEHFAIMALKRVIEEVIDNPNIFMFNMAEEAIEYTKTNRVDIAFLDIEMVETNGIDVATSLKSLNDRINIIFVTGHLEYAVEAFSLLASGYLLKPVAKEDIINQMNNLRYPIEQDVKRVTIKTFGNFEIFVGNTPVPFSRQKSKELLAYLVDRQGSSVTRKELAGILWEDKYYSRSVQTHLQLLISDMIKSLKAVGVDEIIIRQRNGLAIDTSKVNCDYFNFTSGDTKAVKEFTGEYMSNYSWAECTGADLSKNLDANLF